LLLRSQHLHAAEKSGPRLHTCFTLPRLARSVPVMTVKRTLNSRNRPRGAPVGGWVV
jgi:hypothetical protein